MQTLTRLLTCCFKCSDLEHDAPGCLLPLQEAQAGRALSQPVRRLSAKLNRGDESHLRELVQAARNLHHWASTQSAARTDSLEPIGLMAADQLRLGFLMLEDDRPQSALSLFWDALERGATEPALHGIRRVADYIERTARAQLPDQAPLPPLPPPAASPAESASAENLREIDAQIAAMIEDFFDLAGPDGTVPRSP